MAETGCRRPQVWGSMPEPCEPEQICLDGKCCGLRVRAVKLGCGLRVRAVKLGCGSIGRGKFAAICLAAHQRWRRCLPGQEVACVSVV